MKNKVSDGKTMPWTNATGSLVAGGTVVKQSHSLGVLVADTANGVQGTLEMEGEFTVPKVPGAVFVAGEKLLWDVSAGQFDDSAATPGSGDIMGAAVAAAAGANGETTCRVVLTRGNSTLTP